MSASNRGMVAILVLLTFSPGAHAEPVQIGDGSAFTVTDFNSAADGTFFNSGVFILPGIATGIFARDILADARSRCAPCSPGDLLSLSGSFELRGPSARSAGDDFSVYGIGTLNFHAPAVPVPASSVGAISVTAPFEFDGFVSLYRFPGDVLIFQNEVFGHGFTRAFLSTPAVHDLQHGGTGVGSNDGSIRVFHQQEYTFGEPPAPEPVPEPTTLLLCGTGLAVVLRRSRRLLRAHASARQR